MDVVGIRFKPTGKVLQYAAEGLPLERGEKCVAESENGMEIATVVMPSHTVEIKTDYTSVKSVLRRATVTDLEQAQAHKEQAQEAFELCRQRIQSMNVPMKLVEAEFTLDGRKAIFFILRLRGGWIFANWFVL